jgi:serine phosphatase RsbU (regulator of sigma subunit)
MDVNYPTVPNSLAPVRDMEKQLPAYVAQIKERSDKLTNYFLIGYFAVGLFLATYYDTWLIAFGVGGLTLLAYYATKWALPHSNLYQYVLSGAVGIYMAQYIYQMHGMFEMHFFAFIGSAILITYQNWKLQIPLAAIVVLHHAAFGYLQYIGSPIYFTQLDYMSLETFIIHAVLAAIIFVLCGLWAYTFKKSSTAHIEQSFEIGKLQEANLHKEKLLRMSEDLRSSNERNKDMTDSIQYTVRLQQALFPETSLLKSHFADSFVFNRPQGIVGGDFSWFSPAGTEMMVACVDCTGHGVPGAFMSIIAIDLLNRVTREHQGQSPSVMLQLLDAELNKAIGLNKKAGVLDGMDMVLCRIDLEKKKIQFAGAMNPIILASPNGVQVHRGSGYGLGGYIESAQKKFETRELDFQEGDMLYMFSDGYVHQFGGPKNKKLKISGLLPLIEAIHTLPADEQQRELMRAFDDWKGAHLQTDDALVMGIQLKAALGDQAAAKAA